MAKISLLNSVGATVIIDGVERESVTVDAGTTVHWKVSKEGYVTQEGDYTVWEDTVLPVVLKREEYTITFNVSPTDATLTVNGSAVELTDGKYTMTADDGDVISWSCERDGYVMQSGEHTVDGDDTITITLEEEEGGGSGGGMGGTTYTVVNNTSSEVTLGICDSSGKIICTVAVPANGTATFTTEEMIKSDTEFYVDGLAGMSYSVSLQYTTIYIDYDTSNYSDSGSDTQPASDTEAYSEGGEKGDELELTGE